MLPPIVPQPELPGSVVPAHPLNLNCTVGQQSTHHKSCHRASLLSGMCQANYPMQTALVQEVFKSHQTGYGRIRSLTLLLNAQSSHASPAQINIGK